MMAVFWRMVFEGAIRQARKGREVCSAEPRSKPGSFSACGCHSKSRTAGSPRLLRYEQRSLLGASGERTSAPSPKAAIAGPKTKVAEGAKSCHKQLLAGRSDRKPQLFTQALVEHLLRDETA